MNDTKTHTEGELTLHPKNRRKLMDGDDCLFVAQSTPSDPPRAWANARRLCLCWNMHDRISQSLANVLALARVKFGNLDPDANKVFEEADAILADIEQARKEGAVTTKSDDRP